MTFPTIHGTNNIKAGTITDQSISDTAGIKEFKLDLTYSTQDLYDKSVRIDEDREIQEGITVTFPATGFIIKDSVNGKSYRITSQNGVLVAQEVSNV